MSEPSLILRCAARSFALPLQVVVEVTRMVAPALLLPRAPRYCLGAVDYHGQLVPIVDLGLRLGQGGPRPLEDFVDGRLVFVRTGGGLCGLAVDEVPELSDRPVEPLATTEPSLVGLLLGIVRWREQQAAPLLHAAALLPVGAGVRLRQLLVEVGGGRPEGDEGDEGDDGADGATPAAELDEGAPA